MKIIHTPARFPPYTGGVEQYTYILSKKLVQLGHDVTVICANEPKQDTFQTTKDGINIIRLNYIGKIAQTNLTPSLPVELYRNIQNADLVHTHLPTPWTADISVLAGNLSGTPSVLTYHNDIRGEGATSYIAKLYNATIMRATLSLTDKIITTQESYFARSNIPNRFENKVTTIRNGVDVDRFRPIDVDIDTIPGFKHDVTNLFFLSVLDEYHDYKGLENLLEAIDILPYKYNLVVGGEGSKREYYENICDQLGINDQVQFVGYIPDQDLPRYYNSSDIFVLPSVSSEQEGFGLVLLEALACGTPVITTDVVGVAEEVENKRLGVVISSSNPQQIADAALAIASGNITIQTTQARKICVKKYSWDKIAVQLEKLYKQIVPS